MSGTANPAEVFRKIPLKVWRNWLIITVVLAGLSVGLAHWVKELDRNNASHIPVASAATCALLGMAGFFLALCVCDADWLRTNLFPLQFDILHSSAAIIIGVCMCMVQPIASNLNIKSMLTTPEVGFFSIIGGFWSFVGVYFTLVSVLELRQTINGFPVLIERVSKLIVNTASHDYVRFFAFTPVIGSLARRDTGWEQLKQLLCTDRPIQVICLKKEDLESLHGQFLSRLHRHDVTSDMVRKANDDAEDVITIRGLFAQRHEGRCCPIRVPSEHIPGYYVFANRFRAIVAVPFFLPLPSQVSPYECISGQPLLDRFPDVQILGFETTDSGIVRSVHELCNLYRDYFGSKHGPDKGDGTPDEFRHAVEELLRRSSLDACTRIHWSVNVVPAARETGSVMPDETGHPGA